MSVECFANCPSEFDRCAKRLIIKYWIRAFDHSILITKIRVTKIYHFVAELCIAANSNIGWDRDTNQGEPRNVLRVIRLPGSNRECYTTTYSNIYRWMLNATRYKLFMKCSHMNKQGVTAEQFVYLSAKLIKSNLSHTWQKSSSTTVHVPQIPSI